MVPTVTDAELDEREKEARAGLHLLDRWIRTWEGEPEPGENESKRVWAEAWSALDNLVAEVRRLRTCRHPRGLGDRCYDCGAYVEYKGRPPEWRTGEELTRLEAAERLAEACHQARDLMHFEHDTPRDEAARLGSELEDALYWYRRHSRRSRS